MLYSTTIDSPVGCLTLVASETGVRALLWPPSATTDEAEPVDGAPVARTAGLGDVENTVDPRGILLEAVRQLEEYFAGERVDFDLPLDPHGSVFQRAAWDALLTIPYGETVSYGEQARRLGDSRKARAVGAANGRNPISIIVPCHRVVGANGSLTGFGGGIATKAWLLDHERKIWSERLAATTSGAGSAIGS